MLSKLRSSLLTERHAKLLRIQPMTEEEARRTELVPPGAGFKIPYFTPEGKLDPTGFFRYRFWPSPPPAKGWASIQDRKELRYVQPKDSELHVYMPPLLKSGATWRDVMGASDADLSITEGELKAACVCSQGGIMLGLGGVFSWTSKKHQQALIPILEEFLWKGRHVYLVFDSDKATKPLVQLAASRLATVLTERGAVVHDVLLPSPSEGKAGVDDYLAANSFAEYEALLESTTPVGSSLELHRLNGEVVLVWSGGAAGCVARIEDGQLFTVNQFTRSLYRDRTYLDFGLTPAGNVAAPKLKHAAEEWLAWPCRATASKVTYAPGQTRLTGKGEYNLWRPPSVVPVKGDTSPWEDLLRKMFAGVDAEQLLWFKRWLAFPLQNPGAKLFSCVLMWSHKGGTGKNLLAEAMIPVYGEHNCATIKSRHLISEFNSWAEGKCFIIGDEITLDDRRHISGDLKSMLTNRTIRINRKGIEAYDVPDCANYILTSNDPVAIVLDQGERRTFVHHAPETAIGDAYGRAFKHWLNHENGAAHLSHQLLTLPMADFSPTAEPPDTEAKLELISHSRSDIDTWAVAVHADPDKCLTAGQGQRSYDGRGTTSSPTSGQGERNGDRRAYAVYTPEDLLKIYDPDDRKRTSMRALGIALDRAGFRKASSNNGRLGNYRATFWLVKDPDPKRAPISSSTAAKLYKDERPERFVPPSQATQGKRVQ